MRVNVNDMGYVIGQDHPKAKLSDIDVDLIRELHEDYFFSYDKIVWVFRLRSTKVSKGFVRDICKYRRRCHTATGVKEMRISK